MSHPNILLSDKINYASENARQLAEKVAKGNSHESLKVNLNIDNILANRDPKTLNNILQAIEQKKEFLLYQDKDHYAVIIPAKLFIGAFINGKQKTGELCTNLDQFANGVRLALACYPNFFERIQVIEQKIKSIEDGDQT